MTAEKKRNFWEFLAFLISAVFSPYITAAAFIILITYSNAQNMRQFLPWIGIEFFFAIIIPGIYLLWLVEKKDVHDIHLSNRDARKFPFVLTAVSSIIGALALYFVGAAKPVVTMGVAYAANAVVIAILTLCWKISVHTALYSSVITVTVILYGIEWAFFYLLIIPLAWSRVYRNRHTISQVIGGALIAFVITALIFWLFGYI